MKTDNGIVLEQKKIADGIFSMWIETEVAAEAKAGQFVAIYPKAGESLLQRPISICQIRDDRKAIRIVYRVVGKGTSEFSTYDKGDTIRLLGPCGNGFDTSELTEGQTAILIGGGIGVPPMLQLGRELRSQGKKFKFVMGYRDNQLFLKQEFDDCAGAENVVIATEDGSCGVQGNVVDAMRALGIEGSMIFSCGPMPMLKALKEYARDNSMKAFISLEERMACGVGACLGCVCKTTKVDGHSHVNNARVCMEGPVFDAEEVEI